MNTEVMFSKKSDLWKTPSKIYNWYMEHNFFDPCPVNPDFDGLKIEWKEYNFVNPPYSQISKWIDKAIEENKKKKVVVMLLPARTDTKWFHDYVLPHGEIEFLKGRIRFVGATKDAPFPSMIVVFNGGYNT